MPELAEKTIKLSFDLDDVRFVLGMAEWAIRAKADLVKEFNERAGDQRDTEEGRNHAASVSSKHEADRKRYVQFCERLKELIST